MTWLIYLLTVIVSFPSTTYVARFSSDVTLDRLITIAAVSLIPFLNIIFAVIVMLIALLDYLDHLIQKRVKMDKVLFKRIKL